MVTYVFHLGKSQLGRIYSFHRLYQNGQRRTPFRNPGLQKNKLLIWKKTWIKFSAFKIVPFSWHLTVVSCTVSCRLCCTYFYTHSHNQQHTLQVQLPISSQATHWAGSCIKTSFFSLFWYRDIYIVHSWYKIKGQRPKYSIILNNFFLIFMASYPSVQISPLFL